jgi:hypothetical protein
MPSAFAPLGLDTPQGLPGQSELRMGQCKARTAHTPTERYTLSAYTLRCEYFLFCFRATFSERDGARVVDDAVKAAFASPNCTISFASPLLRSNTAIAGHCGVVDISIVTRYNLSGQ